MDMTDNEKMAELEEMMDLDEGTLKPDSVLLDFEEWDSLTALSLIAFAKQKFGLLVTADEIKKFVTVQDVCDFLHKG